MKSMVGNQYRYLPAKTVVTVSNEVKCGKSETLSDHEECGKSVTVERIMSNDVDELGESNEMDVSCSHDSDYVPDIEIILMMRRNGIMKVENVQVANHYKRPCQMKMNQESQLMT